LTQLGKAGLRPVYDENGQLTGTEDDTNSEAYQTRKVLNDTKETQQELNEAKAELARAGNDPNSAAYKLAAKRAQTASANAAAAQERARAYMGNYLGHYKGVDEAGQPLEGATMLEGGKPVGSAFQSTVQNQQGRVAQFNDVLGATDNIENVAQKLVSKGKSLNSPSVAAAIADPKTTSHQWAQGQFVNSGLSPEERDYVVAVKGYKENLQALRKSAGGGVSDAQVDRLMQMAPGPNTPDLDYLKRQTGQIRQMAGRLSKGIPDVKGGEQVGNHGGNTSQETIPPQAARVLQEGVVHTFNNGQQWTLRDGKPERIK